MASVVISDRHIIQRHGADLANADERRQVLAALKAAREHDAVRVEYSPGNIQLAIKQATDKCRENPTAENLAELNRITQFDSMDPNKGHRASMVQAGAIARRDKAIKDTTPIVCAIVERVVNMLASRVKALEEIERKNAADWDAPFVPSPLLIGAKAMLAGFERDLIGLKGGALDWPGHHFVNRLVDHR